MLYLIINLMAMGQSLPHMPRGSSNLQIGFRGIVNPSALQKDATGI